MVQCLHLAPNRTFKRVKGSNDAAHDSTDAARTAHRCCPSLPHAAVPITLCKLTAQREKGCVNANSIAGEKGQG
eukprot:1161894-Pelagomonas_calceolata.AAC.7